MKVKLRENGQMVLGRILAPDRKGFYFASGGTVFLMLCAPNPPNSKRMCLFLAVCAVRIRSSFMALSRFQPVDEYIKFSDELTASLDVLDVFGKSYKGDKWGAGRGEEVCNIPRSSPSTASSVRA